MKQATIDVLVVGAGFGGIYELYSFREMGLSTLLVDKASNVGGTWFWNTYPGAMSDTESYLYQYSWDKDLLRTYPWKNHYLKQAEVLAYLDHVVDKNDLRKDMRLSTELVAATWDEDSNVWLVQLQSEDGEISHLSTRYLITALGLLSTPIYPDIPGLPSFGGRIVHTAAWTPDIEVKNKRVGVIGCGSTGIQVITELSKKVASLVSFQRRPQYSVPSGDKPINPEYRKWVNENYDQIWNGVWNSNTGFGIPESQVPFASVAPEKREQVFEELWQQGNGFRFMFGGFSDITTNKEANEAAAQFIKNKISQIVKDPETARKLTPKDAYARRPLCDGGYYQCFNRENVSVVSLDETPIKAIVPEGIETMDGTIHDLDLIIFATGFDAVEGSYNRIRIQGRNGRTLQDHWATQGPTSFMGVALPGFPNLFTLMGPQGPFSNNPPCIELEVMFHRGLIEYAEKVRRESGQVVEVTPEAEAAWVEHCEQIAEGSLFKETASWIFGNNVSGKQIALRFYFGGLKAYRQEIDKVVTSRYSAFQTV
ncbi:hypothetical protein FE257_003109 [Aspergillus nanangensis]|uniref:Cyclohexanone monooxygenase n=1 Tax=Aspergillus nanangensis TaxID=2582783 RepID=A0AAD4CDA0_ASPNN|nr:hypothetical protein FE257_003109 [Aspergillus nanangensis]